MKIILKKLCLLLIIVLAFYMAGHIGMWIENFHDNPVAGAGVFSISFISMLGGIIKVWYQFIT